MIFSKGLALLFSHKNPAAWRGEYWQLFEHCPSCGRKRLGYRRLNGRRKVCRFRRDCIPGKGWA